MLFQHFHLNRASFRVLLIAFTMLAGLAIRFVHLGLPPFLVKYGGSALWAMMIYWIASSIVPAWPVGPVAVLAACVATLVEFFKLYHAPALDGFRRTLSSSPRSAAKTGAGAT
jgi:hypothetical protein